LFARQTSGDDGPLDGLHHAGSPEDRVFVCNEAESSADSTLRIWLSHAGSPAGRRSVWFDRLLTSSDHDVIRLLRQTLISSVIIVNGLTGIAGIGVATPRTAG
jgi:hypothetical protein